MIPHFDIPFRMVGNHAAVNDQDTIEDVDACVEAILRTHTGQRLEVPTFGVPDLTFGLQPLKLGPVINAVLDQEPRASMVAEQTPDTFDSYVARITAKVAKKETAI